MLLTYALFQKEMTKKEYYLARHPYAFQLSDEALEKEIQKLLRWQKETRVINLQVKCWEENGVKMCNMQSEICVSSVKGDHQIIGWIPLRHELELQGWKYVGTIRPDYHSDHNKTPEPQEISTSNVSTSLNQDIIEALVARKNGKNVPLYCTLGSQVYAVTSVSTNIDGDTYYSCDDITDDVYSGATFYVHETIHLLSLSEEEAYKKAIDNFILQNQN